MDVSRRLFLVRVAPLPILAPVLSAKRRHVSVPAVKPLDRDVATLDGILAAFYEVISGAAGVPRQWARDRTLYIPGVRFVSLKSANGRIQARVYDHQAYVDATDLYLLSQGFFEREIHRSAVRFGNFTHVLSTYESRNASEGPLIARGVNSIQLFWDGNRWWIAGAVWDDERPDNPIPQGLLPPASTPAPERKGS
jgi:hypothetical protein